MAPGIPFEDLSKSSHGRFHKEFSLGIPSEVRSRDCPGVSSGDLFWSLHWEALQGFLHGLPLEIHQRDSCKSFYWGFPRGFLQSFITFIYVFPPGVPSGDSSQKSRSSLRFLLEFRQ